MNDFALFLGKFLRHGTAIASVAPSSVAVADDGSQYRLGKSPRLLVELAPGPGRSRG